jgi:hypothetical protein
MTGVGVRHDKAALSSECKPHPATAPAGSNWSNRFTAAACGGIRLKDLSCVACATALGFPVADGSFATPSLDDWLSTTGRALPAIHMNTISAPVTHHRS